MQYFYDGQIRRYLIQVIRLMSNFVVRRGDGTLDRIPVMYGDMDRQVANILNQGSENMINSAPRIAVYISDLQMDTNRLGDASYVGKVHVRERNVTDAGDYGFTQGQNYTVERLMPTPYRLTFKTDIWASSTEQKLQILEQILMLFNPSLEIQTTDNYIDWTSLSVVDLKDIHFTSRTVPAGTDATTIDVATLTLETPIWISPPAKVKKLGVITNIIANMFLDTTNGDSDYIAGLGVDPNSNIEAVNGNPFATERISIGNFDIVVEGKNAKIISFNSKSPIVAWTAVFDKYPGKYTPGLAKILLRQADASEVIGYGAVNPLDDSVFTISSWDVDTYPTNDIIEGPARLESAWGSFDAVIDPTKTGPTNPQPGTRYLIIEGIGGGIRESFISTSTAQLIDTGQQFSVVNDYKIFVNDIEVTSSPVNKDGFFFIRTDVGIPINSTVSYELYLNVDGPDAWKNDNGTDFIAEANDIIEWDGHSWTVVFSAKEHRNELLYQTNIFTLVQYKWNGVSWVKSFEGEYKKGQWRIEL